jgi:hypothetical protein
MNTKQIIAAAVIALVGSAAFAQEAVQNIEIPTSSNVQRADVKAEVLRARAAGELSNGEAVVVSAPAKASTTLTRAAVRDEFLQARAAGKVVYVGDVAQYANDTAAPVRTREEVKAEARAFARLNQTANVQTAGY